MFSGFRHTIFLLVMLLHALTGFAQRIYPAQKGGKWGYINRDGEVVVPFIYDRASEVSNGFARAVKGNSLYLISGNTKTVELENCSRFMVLLPGYFKVMRSNLWWLVDTAGRFISHQGYERLWINLRNNSRIMVAKNGLTGVIGIDGQEIIPIKFFNLTPVTEELYLSTNNNRTYCIIGSGGKNISGDSFKTVNYFGRNLKIILAKNPRQKTRIFNQFGEQIIADHGLEAHDAGNDFFEIIKSGEHFLYDALRNLFIDSVRGKFSTSGVLNTVNVTNNSITKTFDRNLGYVHSGSALTVWRTATNTKPGIVRGNGLFGLMDIKNRLLLPPAYIAIDELDDRRFQIMDTGFSLGIYNFRSEKWEHKTKYTGMYSGSNFIKAYGTGNFLDHYVLNDSGEIKETFTYYNVVHTFVNSRRENDEGWPSASVSRNFTGSGRITNWYSTTIRFSQFETQRVYGLRRWDSFESKWKILAHPVYTSMNILNIVPLSIAGYSNNLKSTLISANGMSRAVMPPNAYCLINDFTGKKLTPMVEYIDDRECEDNSSPYFRTFHNGKTHLISKTTLKGYLSCLYAKRQRSGVRQVYIGGRFRVLSRYENSNAILSDFNFFTSLGFDWQSSSRMSVEAGEWGLLFANGKLVKPEISAENKIIFMSDFENGKSIVSLSNGKCGVIDTLGRTVISAKYDYITSSRDLPGFYYCGVQSLQYGLANSYGEIVSPPVFESIRENGSVFSGIKNDSMYFFQPGETPILIGKRKTAIDFFDGVGFIHEKKGLELYTDNGKNPTGKMFRKALPFHEGYAPVMSTNRWGLIDTDGHFIINPKFSNAKPFGYTLATFEQNNRWYFVDLGGNKIKGPSRAQAVEEIAPGILLFEKGGKYGIYHENGKKISPFRFQEKPFLKDGNVIGVRGSQIFFYSKTGEKLYVLHGQHRGRNEQILDQTAEHVRDKDYGHQHVIHLSPGQLKAFGVDSFNRGQKIPLAINSSVSLQRKMLFEAYQNDVYLTHNNYEYQFVNSNNEKLINYTFNYAEPMENGTAICRTNEMKMGVLDKDGFWLIKPEYSGIQRFGNGYYSYRIQYDYDIYDAAGNTIVPEPVQAFQYSGGVLQLQSGNKSGYYTREKGMVWPLSE